MNESLAKGPRTWVALVAALALLLGLAGAPPAHAGDAAVDIRVNVQIETGLGQATLKGDAWAVRACPELPDGSMGDCSDESLGTVTAGMTTHSLNLSAGRYKFVLLGQHHGAYSWHGGSSWDDARLVTVGSDPVEMLDFDVSLRAVKVDFTVNDGPDGWSTYLFVGLYQDGVDERLGHWNLGSGGSGNGFWEQLVSAEVDLLWLQGSGGLGQWVGLDANQDEINFEVKPVTLNAEVRNAGRVNAYRVDPVTGNVDSRYSSSWGLSGPDGFESLVDAGAYAFQLEDSKNGILRWLGVSADSPRVFEVDGSQPTDLVFEFGITKATIAKPELSGTAQVGKTLTAAAGAGSPGYGETSYQWYRGNTKVSGAKKSTYKLTTDDIGKQVKVETTYTVDGFAPAVASATTAKVTGLPLTTIPSVSISGTIQVGKTVTASHGAFAPTGGKVSYQWLRDGKAISGATSKSYKPVATDKGKKLTVQVSYSLPGYEGKTIKSGAKTVAAGVFTSVPKPTITGTKQVGKTLTAKHSASSPAGTVKYQWYRGSSAIQGSTKKTYKLVAKDKGQKIKVKVTYSKSAYTTKAATSAATGKVAAGKLTATPKPTISGTKKVGKTLTAKKVAYKPAGGKVTYQWYRGSSKIKGATKAKYKLVKADKGKKIKVKTTYKLSGYTTGSKTSSATAKIK